MILSKIFYGSSYLGFDVMEEIDPLLGPPLMYIFITLSSILLTGSLTGESIHNPPSQVLGVFFLFGGGGVCATNLFSS